MTGKGKRREGKGRGSGLKPRITAENHDFYKIFIFESSCTHCPSPIWATFGT